MRAITRCRLLVLDAGDFHQLVAADGDLRDAINRVAEERLMGSAAPDPGVSG